MKAEQFRKKQITVTAVQFTNDTKDSVFRWAQEIQMNICHDWDSNKNPLLVIPTLEGDMICHLGDWIIVEPFPTDWRKLYPCKHEIFEKTYEPINTPSSQLLEKVEQLKAEFSDRRIRELNPIWVRDQILNKITEKL